MRNLVQWLERASIALAGAAVGIGNVFSSCSSALGFLINGIFALLFLHVFGYNLILVTKLCLDWETPHQLVIGWKGVSLIPVLESLSQPEPKNILLIPAVLLLFHCISIPLLIYPCFSDLRIGKQKEQNSVDILFLLLKRLFHFLAFYEAWHFILFVFVMYNNSGCPMGFTLGIHDVRIFPV